MAIKTLEDLFIHELSDVYSAEKQLSKALPRMAQAGDVSRPPGDFFTQNPARPRAHLGRSFAQCSGMYRARSAGYAARPLATSG